MRLAHILIMVSLVLAANPPVVDACSCGPLLDIPEAADGATAVFVGRVVELRIVPVSDPDLGLLFENVSVILEVRESWTGVTTSTVKVSSSWTCCMCGYGFSIGQSYLIYAYGPASSMVTSVCSRTKPRQEAEEEIARIRELYVTLFENPKPEE